MPVSSSFTFGFVPFVVLIMLNYPMTSLAQQAEPPSRYIFEPGHLASRTADIKAIYSKMALYYEAVERAKPDLLDTVFHPDWNMRDTDTPGEARLNVEDKSTFIKRVRDHGPYPNYANERVFADISLAYDRLAFIRINKDRSRSSTSFFFFKLDDEWIIMDKVWVNVRKKRHEPVPLSDSYSQVERQIKAYFDALASQDRQSLDDLLEAKWDYMYLDVEGQLNSRNKDQFLDNLQDYSEFVDYDQLLRIEVYHDRLAVVRVDQPTKGRTTFIVLFKINGKWMITNNRQAGQQKPGS